MADVQSAIEIIFPLVYEFRKERTPEDLSQLQAAKRRRISNLVGVPVSVKPEEVEEEANSECETEDTW